MTPDRRAGHGDGSPAARGAFGALASLPLGGASCRGRRGCQVPREFHVGAFSVQAEFPLMTAYRFRVIGVGHAVLANLRRVACLKLQRAPIPRDERRAGEDVILVPCEQVLGQDQEFAGCRDDGDLRTAARPEALVKGPQRPRGLHRCLVRLHQDGARLPCPRLVIAPYFVVRDPDCHMRGSTPKYPTSLAGERNP